MEDTVGIFCPFCKSYFEGVPPGVNVCYPTKCPLCYREYSYELCWWEDGEEVFPDA